LGGRGGPISEFESSLVSRVSSRTARATQRNPVSKKLKIKTKKQKQNLTKQNR
jgi:ACT domain-containing protein